MQVSRQLLKKKPFIYFGLSCSLLIIVGSSLFISGMFRENQTIKKNELSAITQLKTEQLVGWYDERYADAITIASSPFIVDATAALIKGNAGGSKSAIEQYLQNICKHYGYTSAFIAAPHGKLLLGTDPSIKVFDTKTRSRLYVAIRDRQVISSDFYYCLIHRRVHLDFIAPIIDPEQKVIGTLVLRVAPDEVLFPMLGAWPLPSRSGETILFRQDGDSIVYLNNLRFRPDAAFKMHYPLTAIDNPAVQSLSGRTGVMEGRDYRDVPVLAYIVPVPGTNWFLETKIDKSEIYAEVRIRAGFRIINMILALILVITGLAFIYNSRQKEVYKSLYKEEVKLHQLEEQFRTILYSIGDAVIVTNQEAVIQYLNPVAEQLTGWSEAEGRGRHLTEVFHIVNEESHAEVENPVEQVLQKGLVFNLANHTLLITRDGREIPIADSGAPIKDQAGKLSGVVLVFRDQTAEREAQRAIQLSEMQFRSIWESSRDGMRLSDSEGIIIKVNPAFCELVGLKAEQLEGQPISMIYSADTGPRILARHKERVHGGMLPSYLVRQMTLHDGRKCWFEVSNTMVNLDGQNLVLNIFRDITARKQLETELSRSEAELKALFAAMHDVVMVADIEGRILKIAQTNSDLLYRPTAEVIGKSLTEIFPPEYCQLFLGKIQQTLQTQSEVRFDYNLPIQDQVLWFEGTLTPLTADSVLLVARDITERKRIEEALHLQDLQLRQAQKMEALGQLASGIAHDFNNILGIIMGHASLVKRDFKGPEKIQQSIDTIEKTSQRGADLVKRLLTLARKSEPVTAPINLQEMMAEMGNLLRETFPKNITIEVKIASLLPYILADASQIHQVLMNLCINARDAMPQGGKLTLSADTVERVHLLSRFAEAQASSYVLLEVSDTGVGIEPQVIERIFDPFYTTKAPGKGTGLGLTTVHSIVRNHNGYIDVESTPGQGTTFRLYLPVPSLEGIEIQTPEETTTSAGHGQETILLIEDEDYIAELIAATLKAYGYRPLIARDGSEGVNLFRQHQSEVNLVITDMGLPGIMGDEVFRQIKALEPQIPIIIASGYIDPEHKNELLAAGLAQFIQKPYLPEELVKKVREALDKV